MFYTMTVAFALLCAANGAQSDGDLLAQKRPHNPANAATDLVRELLATHGATTDYDLVADPAALVHVQPKDAVVADVDGASPAPKDRKALFRIEPASTGDGDNDVVRNLLEPFQAPTTDVERVFYNKEQLMDAVDLWISDKLAGIETPAEKHGHISSWDVSRI